MRKLILLAFLVICLRGMAQTGLSPEWIAYDRAGAGNSDLQCFTPKNISVEGGNLLIATRAEAANCTSIDLKPANYKYTSGFVQTRNFRFLYGTVEFRAKFGGGNHSGSWPTVWMLDASCQASDPTGTDEACNGQEIDIAEILDGNFGQINQQIHVDNFAHNDGCKAPSFDSSRNYHKYQLVWSPGSLIFKIDGFTTCTVRKQYVPSAPMYLKMSVYVGKFGGPVNDRTLPWGTAIDYIKVTRDGKVLFDDEFSGEPPIVTGQVERVQAPK